MYRIIEMSGSSYAIELGTSGRTSEDEFDEISEFLDSGSEEIKIVLDYKEHGAELIIRDYLN